MSMISEPALTSPRRSPFPAVNPVMLLVIAMLIGLAFLEPRFYSRLNLINVARNTSLLTLVALGQAVVMIVGGFDLSIGAVMAFASVITAIAMLNLTTVFEPAMLAVIGTAIGLVAGLVIGLVNGLIVLKLRINPFMSTLGMASVVGGMAFYLTKGVPVYGLPDIFTTALARTMVAGLPLIVWIGLSAAAALWVLLEFTAFGRHIYAVGGKVSAARSSGIVTSRPVFFAYGLAGLLAAVAGILVTARIGSGQANIGTTSAIEAIAAAVVGGVSLRGGVGKIARVVTAAIFLSIISNGLNLVKIDSKWQTLVLGIAIVFAALAELRSRKGSRI